eukprot:scaffold3637_cov146-Isochrysis_galbana.AAC.1
MQESAATLVSRRNKDHETQPRSSEIACSPLVRVSFHLAVVGVRPKAPPAAISRLRRQAEVP